MKKRNSKKTAPQNICGPNGYLQIRKFVSQAQIKDWHSRIFQDFDHWVEGFTGCYTYGRAWYVDLMRGLLHEYYNEAQQVNHRLLMLPGFVEAMRGVARHLEGPSGETGLPTISRFENLGPYWAYCGVHINRTFDGGLPHCDYEGLSPYPAALFNQKTRAYSAVLSLAVPKRGGDLKIWKRRYLADEPCDVRTGLKDVESVTLKYQVGTLTIFDSFMYHQIGETICDKAHPTRMTAVMHFLYKSKPKPHFEYWF